MGLPAVVLAGCVVKTDLFATAEFTVRLELATPVTVPSVAVTEIVSALVRVVVKVVVDWPEVKLTDVV
jgi:hypothetical protein